ncbi:unnamed protein product [Leuciscus chuanchicus]
MAHGWLGSVLLLLSPFKTGNFMHSDRLSTDTKINKQQIREYANKPEAISKKDKQHQQMKCRCGANKQCQRSDLPFTCLVWLLLLLILGSLVLRIPQNEPDSLLCHTPYLNNVGYGRFTIYYSLLKFGNARVIGLRTKVELGGRKKDSGRTIMYLSFLVLLAGDIQLNPGPDADCAPRVHAAGVGPGSGAEAGRGAAGGIGERAGASAAELVRHLWRPADPEVVGGFPAGDSCGCSVRTTVRVPALEDPEAVAAPCARVDRAAVGVAPADGPADCGSDLAQSRALLFADFSHVDEAEEAILDTDLKSLCVQGSRGAPNHTEVNNVAIANLREVLRQLQVQRVRRTPFPGRPSQNIPPETIETYLMRGIKAAEIARLFAVLEMTICRRMREYGIRVSDLYTDISNDDLDRSVAEIQNLYPNSGYRMMHGHLSSRGVKVQVERVCESLRRVDPQGTQLRALSLYAQ